MKEDLKVWLQFFEDFNRVSVFHDNFWTSSTNLQLFTDSAGGASLGFGAYLAAKWAFAQCPQFWVVNNITYDITVLEMFLFARFFAYLG